MAMLGTVNSEVAIHPGEIVYASITTQTIPRKGRPARTLTTEPIVFGASWDGYSPALSWQDRADRMIIRKFGVEEDLVIVGVEVKVRLGYRARATGYHTGVASEETRNKITGAYE